MDLISPKLTARPPQVFFIEYMVIGIKKIRVNNHLFIIFGNFDQQGSMRILEITEVQ